MPFPLISEYLEAIKSAEDNFEELSYLRPVLGDDGLPVMTSGNFAVVFKMKDEETGEQYALKCFTKEQQGRAEAYHQIADELKDVDSPYLVSLQYLDKELFVDTDQTDETEFPVLLMDWVEGKTLDKYLREILDDKYALETLAYRFSLLAQWLIPQPFAHGDLKPDNILVREDGTLVLVDYDGMYVPAMKGQKARELGSPDFRHPLRTENDFDEHIDDFPLISILLSLKAISVDSSLLKKFGTNDRLLLSRNDYISVDNSPFLKSFFPSLDSISNLLVSLFLVCLDRKEINSNTVDYIYEEVDSYLSKLVIVDDSDKYIDGYGTEYSKNKKRLYKIGRVSGLGYGFSGHIEYVTYKLEEDIRIICNNAYNGDIQMPAGYYPDNNLLTEISLDNVIAIGDYAFKGLSFLWDVDISANLIYAGRNPFALTEGLRIRNCFSPHFYADDMALYTKKKDILIHVFKDHYYWYRVPDGVKVIGEYSFSRKSFNETINHYISLPDSVETIGDFAFQNCNLCEIRMPRALKHIGVDIFSGCNNLRVIRVPQDSFGYYWKVLHNYRKIIVEESFPDSYIDSIDYNKNHCFHEYELIDTDGRILNEIIEDDVTRNCWTDDCGVKYNINGDSLLNAPFEISHGWKKGLLKGNYSIKLGTMYIGNKAFYACSELLSVKFPESIRTIGNYAFFGCRNLTSVDLNQGVCSIGDSAFKDCINIQFVFIPESVEFIGKDVFSGCNIKEILTSNGNKERMKMLLPDYKDYISELPF